jgi:hypothetical protein
LEEHGASIFRVEEYDHLAASFMLGIVFNSEDGGNMFLQNVV